MIEVAPNLWVGSQADYEGKMFPLGAWAVVFCAKEPWHRQALGYSGRSAPVGHPEYLVARRGCRLILNLVDVDNPDYVHRELVDAAMEFIAVELGKGKRVLIICNQGKSRSPVIAMLYLGCPSGVSFEDAEADFKQRYPDYAPARGMREFARTNWDRYAAFVGDTRITV